MDLKGKTNKELHFLFSQENEERLEKKRISGGIDLELKNLNKNDNRIKN